MGRDSYTFRIQRFDPAVDKEPYYQDFVLKAKEGMTVLEALLHIQAEQDGALSFRYACRGAVCGSCAMIINGREDLACRSQVRDTGRTTLMVYQGTEREEAEVEVDDPHVITIEPLRNMPLVKDLVVDMEPFLGKVDDVQPWLQPAGPDPERERLVEPKDWAEAAPYINCILCGCCHSVCPAAEKDDNYLGPAALAAHYRFLGDLRDAADESRMNRVDNEIGVWGCDMVWNCGKVCPKDVPPTQGIAKTRARIRRAQRGKS